VQRKSKDGGVSRAVGRTPGFKIQGPVVLRKAGFGGTAFRKTIGSLLYTCTTPIRFHAISGAAALAIRRHVCLAITAHRFFIADKTECQPYLLHFFSRFANLPRRGGTP
jgi:hypothetical protein